MKLKANIYREPANERDTEILEYLAMYRNLEASHSHPEYRFAKMLLERGSFYTFAHIPIGYPIGTPGNCFADAAKLATDHRDLAYVEGYALGIIPTHHAWCVNNDGIVIDTSWASLAPVLDKQPSYFGIIVDTGTLLRQTFRQGSWGYFARDHVVHEIPKS